MQAKTLSEHSMRLAIVLPNLRCGGIQRAVTTLTQGLLQRGHAVTLFTFSDDRADFFAIPRGAQRVALGIRSSKPTPALLLAPRTLRRLRALRHAVMESKPDVVLAHAPQINVPTLLALSGLTVPVVVAEHGDVPAPHWRKAAWYRMRRWCYSSAYKVVSVSEAVDRNVDWLARERRAVIPNPIAADSAPKPDGETDLQPTVDGDFIASMGRLSHAKGFDVLIEAFARVAADFPHWKLVIIGDGELRQALQRQADNLGLRERVVFTGALTHPFALLRQAKFFAMASRYEGFPLAHAEALACGLPIVATDCPSRPTAKGAKPSAGGVRELIRRSVDGLLTKTEDPAALARGLAELMSDPAKRQLLGNRTQDVFARFSPDKIVDAWDGLLHDAARSGRLRAMNR